MFRQIDIHWAVSSYAGIIGNDCLVFGEIPNLETNIPCHGSVEFEVWVVEQSEHLRLAVQQLHVLALVVAGAEVYQGDEAGVAVEGDVGGEAKAELGRDPRQLVRHLTVLGNVALQGRHQTLMERI